MSNRRKLPVSVQDQMDAAAADAYRKIRAQHPEGRLREGPDEDMPTAHRRINDLLFDSLERPMRVCPHKDPFRAEVTHWFAAMPDMRMCGRCAEPIVEAWRQGVNQCDLCYRQFPHDALTLATGAAGHFVIHAALCDECHPEGADAPRVSY